MKNHNEIGVGFRWRVEDRATKRGNWLRDLAIALVIALAASILGMIGDAYAQAPTKLIQISGNNRTAMVTRADRQVAGRAHRCELRRHHGWRSGSCRRQSADRPRAVDPRKEDRHDPRVGLCRRQEACRHLRYRGVLRHHAAAATSCCAVSRARESRRRASTAASCCRARSRTLPRSTRR